MLSVYYLTLAFLVAVTSAAVMHKEELEDVLDVGSDYTKLEEEENAVEIEEDSMEIEGEIEKDYLVEEEESTPEHKTTETRLGMDKSVPAESCREIYDKNYDSRNSSGYYWIKSAEGTIKVHEQVKWCNCIKALQCQALKVYSYS